MQSNPTYVNPTERRIGSDANLWNHHNTVFLQVRKSHYCTEETQRKTAFSCGRQEKQNLIRDDYTKNNKSFSTVLDAAQHLAGKSLFYKMDCSHD